MTSFLSNIPAMRPPPGVRPNFDNPVSRASQVQIATGLTAPPMALFMGLRIYSRLASKSWGAEDCKFAYLPAPASRKSRLASLFHFSFSLLPSFSSG
jgi:hypothetical protein